MNAVEKAMGLKKGEKVKQLCQIRIVSTRPERLDAITDEDVVREGFPDWTSQDFVRMYARHNKCAGGHTVNRIEFEYL